MDWDKRCIGHQITIGCEECARKVKSLLDVRADCGLLQSSTHGLGDGHEPVREKREQDRIWRVGGFGWLRCHSK
jgi:hypothetical protein